MDTQPRSKNGQPPHNTTGVARISSIQFQARGETMASKRAENISVMARATTGAVRTRLIQNRRPIAASSGFASSSASTVFGSSAMPQMGQVPGSFRATSGCMGQVKTVCATAGETGSSAMPHSGHAPARGSSTSGCIGQVNESPARVFSPP